MTRDKMLPIEWEGWDSAGDDGDIQFYKARFLDNFGDFKKGELVSCLVLLASEGRLYEVDEVGEEGRSHYVQIVPRSFS